MKEKSKHLRPIQNMVVLALLVLLSILTTQTSAIARPLTRAQMAVILGQGIHGSLYTPPAATGIFADVPLDHGAADWIEQFYKDGITSGCGQNPLLYCPENLVTRAQMAVFLLGSKHGSDYTPPAATGIFGDVPVDHWAAAWIEQLYNEGITRGCSQNPLLYCPESSVTGVQTSVFIVRAFRLPAPVPMAGSTGEDEFGHDRGVPWPDPRFTDNGDGTVTDHLTNLVWLKNADCFGASQYGEAGNASRILTDGQCGLTDGSSPGDWLLPNIRELYSLIDYDADRYSLADSLPYGHPFVGVPAEGDIRYWSRTDKLWNCTMRDPCPMEPPGKCTRWVWILDLRAATAERLEWQWGMPPYGSYVCTDYEPEHPETFLAWPVRRRN